MRRESRYNTVIVVEDDDVDAYLNRRLLESSGLASDISVFLNAVEALEYIRRNISSLDKPAVLLLDMDMPALPGIDFLARLEAITENDTNLSVLVVTAFCNETEKEKAMRFPFVKGYIEKPVTISHLSNFFLQ